MRAAPAPQCGRRVAGRLRIHRRRYRDEIAAMTDTP